MCCLEEINQLLKRIEKAREMGVDLNLALKDRLAIKKAQSHQDEFDSETHRQKQEILEKTRIKDTPEVKRLFKLAQLGGASQRNSLQHIS